MKKRIMFDESIAKNSIKEIAERVAPVAKQFNIPTAYLFGSYARGQATENSDIDLLIDTAGTELTSLFKLGALYDALEETLKKPIHLITIGAFTQQTQMENDTDFRNAVMQERIILYTAD